MSPASTTVRAFLAFEIPEGVKAELELARDQILRDTLPPARWTRPEGWHLTVQFLGESDTERLKRLTADLAPRLKGCGAIKTRLTGGGFFSVLGQTEGGVDRWNGGGFGCGFEDGGSGSGQCRIRR